MIHDYDEAIAYLERLVATPVRNDPGAGLERARLLLAHVGAPHQRFVTLHVTGSSGKGSTAAMAASMLRAAGYRVGVFASPHLESYTERIAVDGAPISPHDWTRLLNRLRPLVDEMAAGSLPGYTLGRPALLQVLWPMAALYFAARGVEVAVVEVGMGGRYDSTNVNNASVAVITNVTLEHTRQLGATVAEIAQHKAGVAKPAGIVVTAAQGSAALEVIADECAAVGATLWRVSPHLSPSSPSECGVTPAPPNPLALTGQGGDDPRTSQPPRAHGAKGSTVPWPSSPLPVRGRGAGGEGIATFSGGEDGLTVTTPLRDHHDLRLGLRGRHQRANAACAVAAVDALQTLGLAQVHSEAVARGLADAFIAGRLEWAAQNPPTLLDGAHNPDAARTLAVALRDLFPNQKIVLLLGILGDKDIGAMVDALAPLAQAVIVTEPPWEGRMGKGAEVAAAAERNLSDVALVPDVAAALALAQERARQRAAPLVVAGSLILVGAVRPLLRSP